MPDIRVSFQGGGAFLAAMLPIADAIDTVRKDRLIRIEGVSGTSAGSICAALLAGRCDFDELRLNLKNKLEFFAKDLAGPLYHRKLDYFNQIYIIVKVLLGHELIDIRKMENFISYLLSFNKIKHSDISEFNNDMTESNLYITRSKLSSKYFEVCTSGNIVKSILDSCSIPFAMKGHRSVRFHDYVDGGLCENLPVSCFDIEKNIPIFGVSASNKNAHIDVRDPISYVIGLLSMTSGYSVVRSRESIGDSFYLNETVPFEFHHISRAVEWFLNDTNYDSIKKKYLEHFNGFCEYYRVSHIGPVFMVGRTSNVKRDQDINELSRRISNGKDWEILDSTMVVTANSADPLITRTKTDIIQIIGRVKAKDDSLSIYRGHVHLANNEIHPTAWSVFNETKQCSVGFRAIHYKDNYNLMPSFDPCDLLFDDPHRDISENDIIEIRATMPTLPSSNMANLRSDGDFIRMTNQHTAETQMYIILRYPAALGSLRIQARRDNAVEFDELEAADLQPFSDPMGTAFRTVGVRSRNRVKQKDTLSVEFVREA